MDVTIRAGLDGVFDPDRAMHLPRFATRLLLVARVSSVAVVLLGVTVLMGYAVRSERIVQLAPTLPPMYPNAAIAFVLGGLAVRLAAGHGRALRRWVIVLGAALAGLGTVILTLHLVDAGPTWVEGLWPADPFVAATTPVPGRPAPEASVAFIASGAAIVLVGFRRHPLLAQGLALASITVGVAATLGYLIGVDRALLGGSFVAVGMALHTAVGIVLLGTAILLVRPSVGLLGLLSDAGAGGRLARRLVLVALVAPIGLAAAAALLDEALPDARLARSIVTVVQVGALGLLVMIPAAAIIRFDQLATAATREVRRQREAAGERDALVRAIATNLFQPPPSPAGWTLAARQEPATGELAGDNLVVLDTAADRFVVAILDVTGHGTIPALQAYRLRIELASLWRQQRDLPDIVEHLDHTVVELGTLASGVFLDVDRLSGETRIVNAGHPAAVLLTGGGTDFVECTGPVLGISADRGVVTRSLGPGDMIVLYTDGVTEAANPERRLLGEDAVHRLIHEWAPSGPDVVVERCVDAAHAHADQRLRDDALVVALQRR